MAQWFQVLRQRRIDLYRDGGAGKGSLRRAPPIGRQTQQHRRIRQRSPPMLALTLQGAGNTVLLRRCFRSCCPESTISAELVLRHDGFSYWQRLGSNHRAPAEETASRADGFWAMSEMT